MNQPPPIITLRLLKIIKKHYPLNWLGTHGIIHWSRVYENGLLLASQTGVDIKVVQLFSVFHDSQRKNENEDQFHGNRGAQLALKFRDLCPVNDDEFDMLVRACATHTSHRDHKNITIQACYDADRLDLGRIGKIPDPNYLCTPLGKDKKTIDWAYKRSLEGKLPDRPFGLANLEKGAW